MSHPLVVHNKRSKFDVYIGRPSKWGNPFVLRHEEDREKVLQQYSNWIIGQPRLMDALGELRGKVLGCWCAPRACHGDVLARLANRCSLCSGELLLPSGVPCQNHTEPTTREATVSERLTTAQECAEMRKAYRADPYVLALLGSYEKAMAALREIRCTHACTTACTSCVSASSLVRQYDGKDL